MPSLVSFNRVKGPFCCRHAYQPNLDVNSVCVIILCSTQTAFLLKLFRKRNNGNNHSELHLFQFKWNRNHSVLEQKSVLIYTTVPAITALPAISVSEMEWTEQMEYSSSSTYSQKLLHSIYYY